MKWNHRLEEGGGPVEKLQNLLLEEWDRELAQKKILKRFWNSEADPLQL